MLELEPNVTEVFRTPAEEEHYFGYYDKSPFDAAGRRLLSIRPSCPSTRVPTAEDTAIVRIWDLDHGTPEDVAVTHTFNWQQGSMLQWLGPDFDRRILYNDRREGAYVSIILDLVSREETVLPQPVYSVSADGRWALCANFDRLFWCRPGYNYAHGGKDEFNVPIPKGDGIRLMDLHAGKHELIVTTEQMAAIRPLSSMQTGPNYLEHLHFSPNGERFFFEHRWQPTDAGIFTRPYIANRDGSGIRLLSDAGDTTHYNWRDDRTMILFGSERSYLNALRRSALLTRYVLRPLLPLFKSVLRPGTKAEKIVLRSHYFLIDVDSLKHISVGNGSLGADGHPSFQPGNPDLFLSDTYSDLGDYQNLYLYDMAAQRRIPLCRFFAPPDSSRTERSCHLHPRWNRQGTRICVDSMCSGKRQMFVLALPNTGQA